MVLERKVDRSMKSKVNEFEIELNRAIHKHGKSEYPLEIHAAICAEELGEVFKELNDIRLNAYSKKQKLHKLYCMREELIHIGAMTLMFLNTIDTTLGKH